MIKSKDQVLFITALLTVTANIFAQDPYKDVCAKEVESRVERCLSGRESVWHYTFSGPKDGGRLIRSWGYKSRESAQRALESDKQLCQTVDRYFEKTDCQTTYGAIFCAGCETKNNSSRRPTIEETEMLAVGERQLDRWRSEMTTALKNIRSAQNIGQSSPSAGIGNTLREYIGELRAARERALSVEKLMNSVSKEGANVLNRLSNAISELSTTTERMGVGRTKLSEKISEINAKPNKDGRPTTGNGGNVVMGGRWAIQVFDFYGTPLRQSITVEANSLKILIQSANSTANGDGIRTYTVSLGDLISEKQIMERVGPNLWAVTVFANGRKVTDISLSSNNSITESVSRVKLFFSTEDAAREAANSLKMLSSK